MADKCPLCGQVLPHALTHAELQTRIAKLSSPAIAAAKADLKADFDNRLEEAVERRARADARQFETRLKAAESHAASEARRQMSKQIDAAEKRASVAESRRLADVKKAQMDALAQARREAAERENTKAAQSEAKIQKLLLDHEREKSREALRTARLQDQVADLSRRLENQSGEQFGAEAERDLCAELRAAFPYDKVDPIGRGVKGADILQTVMDGPRVVGTIVYESKNTLTWLNDFIVQAKKYRTQYDTPHVILVTRVFPAKQKGFCVVKDVPVVGPSMAVALATIIRDGIVEIAKLRLSSSSRDGKSQELYEYIVGDKFCARFRELAEGIDALRMQQQTAKRWHQNAWEAESRIHEQIASRHREVDSQISAICSGSSAASKSKIPSRSEAWGTSSFLTSSK